MRIMYLALMAGLSTGLTLSVEAQQPLTTGGTPSASPIGRPVASVACKKPGAEPPVRNAGRNITGRGAPPRPDGATSSSGQTGGPPIPSRRTRHNQ